MAKIIRKINLKELADFVNNARKENVGYEFSFGEDCDGEEIVDNVEGWHTCTKITNTEVCIRYMGGVCHGLITDTDVDEYDMLSYMEDACNLGSFDEKGYVYLETEMDDALADAYKRLDEIRFDYGVYDYSHIKIVFHTLLLEIDIEKDYCTTMDTIYTIGGIASTFYNSDTYADNVKVVFGKDVITLMFDC